MLLLLLLVVVVVVLVLVLLFGFPWRLRKQGLSNFVRGQEAYPLIRHFRTSFTDLDIHLEVTRSSEMLLQLVTFLVDSYPT